MSLHLLTSFSARTRARWVLAACTAALLGACQSPPSQPAASSSPALVASPDEVVAPPIVGGPGVETHGCTASTGHAWCERTQRCERPWELALQRGFENTPEGWHAFCEGATR